MAAAVATPLTLASSTACCAAWVPPIACASPVPWGRAASEPSVPLPAYLPRASARHSWRSAHCACRRFDATWSAPLESARLLNAHGSPGRVATPSWPGGILTLSLKLMSSTNGPFLVTRMQDGFGDVYPLQAGQRFTLGRANTNRIVLKDELCSREHAEVFFAAGRWRLRDLESLNGTRHNGEALEGEGELGSGDEFQVGKTQFLFVTSLEDLPQAPARPAEGEGVAIKKRLGQTRFLTPQPEELSSETPLPDSGRHTLS